MVFDSTVRSCGDRKPNEFVPIGIPRHERDNRIRGASVAKPLQCSFQKMNDILRIAVRKFFMNIGEALTCEIEIACPTAKFVESLA